MNRRELITLLGTASVMPSIGRSHADETWQRGDVVHLIPAANHDRFLLKCSFATPRRDAFLTVGRRRFAGRMTDTEGRYFAFDASGLEPATTYRLQLVEADGKRITDEWPLATFPAPDARPESMRVLAYTCAGGYPNYPVDEQPFLPLEVRQRLLRRALSFAPDAAIAIGDHIYWDQRTQLESANPARAARAAAIYDRVGALDRRLPARGTRNEMAIKRAIEPQIAELYGVMLRSTPSYFVFDDHDYFENDEATDRFVTLPVHAYQDDFARFTRDLFMPEFLPDVARPRLLSGASARDREDAISESFGTLRFGTLAEVLIYDCARFLSLKGDVAGLVPPEVERWLIDRTADQTVRHLVHVPSHPMGWTAGKWREWYPDVADTGEGDTAVSTIGANVGALELTTTRDKFFWQRGWFRQHQRLLDALARQSGRPGIVVSGDLHATGHALIDSSGALELRANPVHSILAGPIGTRLGWPSNARGTPPLPATGIELRPAAEVTEQNGFTLLDITPDEVVVSLFAWRHEPITAIDSLEPYHRYRIPRRSTA